MEGECGQGERERERERERPDTHTDPKGSRSLRRDLWK